MRFLASGDESVSWGCSNCRGEGWERHDFKRAPNIRNCELDPDGQRLSFVFDPDLHACPYASYPEEAFLLLYWYQRWTDPDLRILPYGSATLADEPAFVTEAFELIKQTLTEIRMENGSRS